MPLAEFQFTKGGINAGRKNTVSGKAPSAVEGKSLRDLTWLTAADVKVLASE